MSSEYDLMNDDEKEVFNQIADWNVTQPRLDRIIDRMMGKGRMKYGPLDLATDTRDFKQEAQEEMDDWYVYTACEAVQDKRLGR